MSLAKPETKDDGQQLLKNWQLLTCWHFAVGIFKLPHEALRTQKRANESERLCAFCAPRCKTLAPARTDCCVDVEMAGNPLKRGELLQLPIRIVFEFMCH